jgi:putative ABC transport system permease protein
MLELRNIKKIYQSGALKVEALKDISLTFEKGEFVAVLGPSGCGKTTLLNVIGGLDRYDAGDLRVNGRSTKEYTEREMDAYRNHSVGFVFQSYNLISHQSVLANVELALTLSGISKKERRQRALDALRSVGLSDQVHKKPNQLSGGQMQRVAIARALVNDPAVLLADEPTGALDSVTSEQVLDVLKQLASDRLVIMVTHNQELAERYATRIIELKDGNVLNDSKPNAASNKTAASDAQKKKAMGFSTALSLSLNNLLTKRGRTLITAFAGSIGIIGIALILALSNGVNQYIINVQRNTMSSYPITIEEETFQVEGMRSAMQQAWQEKPKHEKDAVYLNAERSAHRDQMRTTITRNNLTSFKAYLDGPDNAIKPYLTDIRYGYNASFDLYTFDQDGQMRSLSSGSNMGAIGRAFSGFMPFGDSELTEITPSSSDGLAGEPFQEKNTLLAGSWPKSASEVLLELDANNELPEALLYRLGLLTEADLEALTEGEGLQTPRSWAYEDLLGLSIRLMASSDYYVPDGKGLYANLNTDQDALRAAVSQAPVLTISGIIRSNDQNNQRSGGIVYTRALTDLVIARAAQSPVVMAQQADETKSVLTGLRFAPETAAEKSEDLTRYFERLPIEQKAEFAKKAFRLYPEAFGQDTPGDEGETPSLPIPEGMSMEQIMGIMSQFTGGQQDSTGMPTIPEGGMDLLAQWAQMSGLTMESLGAGQEAQTVLLFERLKKDLDDSTIVGLYDQLVAPNIPSLQQTYADVGQVNLDTPTSITLYMDTFEHKEEIARLIEEYNQTVPAHEQINYTDFVALMISGVTNIINVISYVLIAFVAVSLVVSSIMIGIITYISVLERTKEIGILRAVGASRKDVARVFTAEAFIIGLTAGVLGIAISALLIIPINQIIFMLSNDASVKAILPPVGAVILIGISALLSLLAGWLPSRIAAKKDPVECLRAE